MNNSEAWNGDVSGLLKWIYRCADKSSWYGDVVDAYDRTRPRYPAQLLDKVREIAGFQPNQKVLEIGCGPGIATVELAKLGLEIVAIEPNLTACQLARQKCANYSRVKFVNSTFEEWESGEDKFDVVVATTSFHWVTPEIRTIKTASILKEDGYLVLLWNTPPQPNAEAIKELAPVYRVHAPELAQQESLQNHEQIIAKFGAEVIDSGYYRDLIYDRAICEVNYTVDEYLTLLTTLSPYIRLEASQRDTLLIELKEVLRSKYGDRLQLSYLSMFQIACKVSDR